MADLDESLLREGIQKHPGNDEIGLTDGTCIGVDLCDGSFFSAHAPRFALLLLAVPELIRRGSCSPKQLHAVMGVVQWMFLLNRPLFASLDQC